jgi:hypothetical protein
MKKTIIPLLLILFFSCKVTENVNLKSKIIVYKLPFKAEQLLFKQIEDQPKDNYCLLIRDDDDLRKIILVTGYSYYHKNTSYHALIGKKYYPISFPQFDRRYGVVTDAEDFLEYKIKSPENWDSFGKQSYPIYHGMYKIELDSKNNVVFEGFVY